MATFRCTSAFALPPDRFVFAGQVLSGEVRAGMVIQISLNASMNFTCEIHAVELVNTSEGSEVGLVTRTQHEDDLEILDLLGVHEEDLVIE